MAKSFINGVPRYFEPHVNDCFSNAISACLLFRGYNPDLLLADYLSFMYDRKNGLLGLNYLYKPYTTVEFKEEELNTALQFFYFPTTACFDKRLEAAACFKKDRLNAARYIDGSSENAFKRLKELIDEGIPTAIAVDMFHMGYHRAFKKEHGLHYVVITGYDEEEGIFALFDGYRLASCNFDGVLPIEEINAARASDNPQSNVISGEYKRPLKNNWIEIEAGSSFAVDGENLLEIIRESCKRMAGERKVLGVSCGLDMLEAFRADLLLKREELGEQDFYLFKTYYNEAFKIMSRSRRRFGLFIREAGRVLTEGIPDEMPEILGQASRCWDIAANLCYKMAVSKSVKLLDEISRQLQTAADYEKGVVERLMGYVSKVS